MTWLSIKNRALGEAVIWDAFCPIQLNDHLLFFYDELVECGLDEEFGCLVNADRLSFYFSTNGLLAFLNVDVSEKYLEQLLVRKHVEVHRNRISVRLTAQATRGKLDVIVFCDLPADYKQTLIDIGKIKVEQTTTETLVCEIG